MKGLWEKPFLYKSLNIKKAWYPVIDGCIIFLAYHFIINIEKQVSEIFLVFGWREDFYFLLAVRERTKGVGWRETAFLPIGWLSMNGSPLQYITVIFYE